ncbi:Ig-like domain repeat protein [Nocardioides lianchengensis]|uniref:Ig-like domain repeat protein n=1 Tax=Nocardioides lianchengensis TaxID=1045774 RepID=UPI00111333FA|nr:Ig-like domain repeat protein [Nocardioides lianchengensis]NYG09945.1 hypothetical protein [Nocardioides lianchengensis]
MRRAGTALVAAVLGLSALAPLAAADAAPSTRVERTADPTLTLDADLVELPRPVKGRTALRLLDDQVDEAAELNGVSTAQLRDVLRTDDTAWLTTGGLLHFKEPVVAERAARPTPAQAASYPLAQTFALHSKPGSQHTIFIDVDGATVSGTEWHAQYPATPTTHPAWDPAGDGPAFSDPELAIVQELWARVAEDFAPFDVDVTTQDPGAAAILRSSAADPVYGAHALVSPSNAFVTICDSKCGGVAFLDVFDTAYGPGGNGYGYLQPAWVFPQGTGNDPKSVAEALAHEVGHQLGLAHDGNATEGYDAGHGSWAPIMGLGYYRPISQWSKGDYASANNQEDDVAVIGGILGLRTDEAPSTTSGAPTVPGGTSYVSSRTDVDTYRLGTCTGSATVTAAPLLAGGADLDIGLTLVDGSGTVVASADPPSATVDARTASGLDATITASVPPGEYFVSVDGVGRGTWTDGYDDYGSLGAYTVDLVGGCDGGVAAGAPGAPGGPTATAETTTTVTLGWTAPADPGSSAITGYRLTRSGSDQVVDLGPGTTSYTWSGLSSGTSYLFTVLAVNASGPGVGAAISASTRSARPSVPQAVTARWSRATEGVQWRWTAPASDGGLPLTAYDLYVDRTEVGSVPAATTGVNLTGLEPGSYTLGVAARNSEGSGPAAETTVVVPGPPANDAFAARTVLAAPSGSVTGDNTAATAEAGEPSPPAAFAGAGAASVWFSWTAAATGPVTLSTSSAIADRDTTLAVYAGSTLPGLDLVAGNDDVGAADHLSRVSFGATSGTTYAIAVDGYPGIPAGTGPFTLAWSGPTPPAETTTVVSSTVTGRTVTLTAQVTAAPDPPAGAVVFRAGSADLGSVPVSVGSASYVVTGVGAGPRTFTAAFVPSDAAAYVGSTGSTTVELPAVPTTTALSVERSARAVTLVATTTSELGVPTGRARFWDGGVMLGERPVSGGAATLVVQGVTTGAHTYEVEFHPADPQDYASSVSATYPLSVSASPTTTTLTAVDVEGSQVTWSAAVTSADGVPAGTVDLYAGPTSGPPVSSVGLHDGATLAGFTLPPGSYDLIAVYRPLDDTWAPSESAPTTRTVDQPPVEPVATTTALGVSVAGRTVTLTGTVGSGSGTPAGSVQFLDGATVLQVVPLVGGAASTSRVVGAGDHAFRAEYLPADPAVHAGSSSAVQTRRVLPTSTSSALAPSVRATTVTLTSSVSAVGGEEPAGVVRFEEAGGHVGTASVVSGRAVLVLSGAAPGSHTYRATFVPSGPDQAGSTSAARTVTVVAPPVASRTTLTAPRTARAGARPTVTVRVLRGTAPATGSVVLRYGAKRATLPLRGGRATFRLPKAKAGTLRLTATYGGSTTTTASSATTSITVKKAKRTR